VKAYFAREDDRRFHRSAPYVLARDAILAHGGAATCNVFTRAMPSPSPRSPARRPVMPVEIMLLQRWFPFHLDKTSYWARTGLVPLRVSWP